MSGNTLDPKILARMNKDVSYVQSQTRGARRIKIDKGHNLIVRFLPARLGPDENWYARIAQHWLNKVPIICPKHTGDDFGGDINSDCPVCLLSDELNDDSDKDTSSFGWQVRANPQFTTYCLLWEKDDVKFSMDEVILPYEFRLSKATWEELKGYYMAGGRKYRNSVLDYEHGNDFSVIRTAQNIIRLDKLESAAIFDKDDPNWDRHIKKIEAAMKNPKVTIPTLAQLEAFADKVQEGALKLHRSRRDDDDDRPRRRAARGDDDEDRPRRRSRDDNGDEEGSGDEAAGRSQRDDRPPRRRQQNEDDESPRRSRETEERDADRSGTASRRRASADANDDEASPRRRAQVDDEDNIDYGPTRKRTRDDDDDADADRDPESRRSRQREEDPESGRSRKREEDPEDSRKRESEPDPDADNEVQPEEDPDKVRPRGKLPLTENRAKSREAASPTERDDDEEDALPPDDTDKVSPAKNLPAKDKDQEPPPVERKGSKSTAEAIQARLSKLSQRE